jgi:RNA polymerase sigma-32 factor
VRSRSLVTSGVQSKLLSKIRRERVLAASSLGEGGNVDQEIATRLALSPERLRSLVERLEVRDVSWDASAEESLGNRSTELLDLHSLSAEDTVLSTERDRQISLAIAGALSKLDVRERYVVEQRLMAYREEQLSLAEIGRRFQVSRERARQIEARAMRKLKATLTRSAASAQWLAHRLAA